MRRADVIKKGNDRRKASHDFGSQSAVLSFSVVTARLGSAWLTPALSNPKVIDMGQELMMYMSSEARGYILHDMSYII